MKVEQDEVVSRRGAVKKMEGKTTLKSLND